MNTVSVPFKAVPINEWFFDQAFSGMWMFKFDQHTAQFEDGLIAGCGQNDPCELETA